MKLGVIVGYEKNIGLKFETLKQLGIPTCQLSIWNPDVIDNEALEEVKKASVAYGIEITAIWGGWGGPKVWDFVQGPLTLGLVPKEYRAQRMDDMVKHSEYALKLGVSDIVTHCGYIPENPCDENYKSLVASLQYIVRIYQSRKQNFLFETGQETPITLKRIMDDIGLPNVGVNLDPANLLMYGKANPVDALDIIGPYVKGVHGKDGEYPTNGYQLGKEKPLGEGRVQYDLFIRKLKQIGYTGAITIEREISGEKQIEDIKKAKDLLDKYIAAE
ncbi:MAG TPA: xylose isomerase [Clostridiales bacterium]|nr:xylose isomerase [Clostridiales bacterium]